MRDILKWGGLFSLFFVLSITIFLPFLSDLLSKLPIETTTAPDYGCLGCGYAAYLFYVPLYFLLSAAMSYGICLLIARGEKSKYCGAKEHEDE